MPVKMENSSRIGVDKYFLQMASLVGERSTCRRRKVGCVLVDSSNHVVATGYNGVPTHFDHCLDNPCEGASYSSGEGLEKCLAVHAEQNAFLQLRSNDELTAYLTISPCITCAKMFANSRVKRIVVTQQYAQSLAKDIIEKAKIKIDIINDNSNTREF
jgi:dCMP deaminase